MIIDIIFFIIAKIYKMSYPLIIIFDTLSSIPVVNEDENR